MKHNIYMYSTLEMIQNIHPQARRNIYMYLSKTVDQKDLNLAFVVSPEPIATPLSSRHAFSKVGDKK